MSETSFELAQAAWPVLLVDAAAVIRRFNTAAQRMFGGKLEGAGTPLSAIWAPENPSDPVQFLTQIRQSPPVLLPLRLRGPQPTAIAFLAAAGDVVEGGGKLCLLQLFPGSGLGDNRARAAETSVAHKQKLDCALQLTRTVALDFNNTLTTILGHTSHLLSRAGPDHPWRMSLMEMEKAAGRGAEIANNLATFSTEEKDTRARAAASLNELVRRTIELFKTPQNAEITWQLQLEGRLFASKYDEAKIQQTIVRVCENALQAISGKGQILVQTRNLELSEPTQDHTAQLKAGPYVCLEISDDGCGIKPEILPRVFEPFFTTKQDHRGLGLAYVYGIVTNHGGGVAISNKAGGGTSVRIYLPAIRKIMEEKDLPGAEAAGSQTVLVVDDEEMVLTMSQMVLSSRGYRVLTASSGEKAMELAGQSKSPIDLLITDMVMPGMNGRELMERMRALSPRTRVVCASGRVMGQAAGDDLSLLPKPFTAQELLRKVKEALATQGGTSPRSPLPPGAKK